MQASPRDNVGVPIPTSLGARIRALRKKHNLSQAEAAAAIGMARSSLTSIETGHDLPGRETMAAIARFFRVPLDYLENGRAASPPGAAQLVDDPDELALLEFWRSLTVEERGLMLKMLRVPDRRTTVA